MRTVWRALAALSFLAAVVGWSEAGNNAETQTLLDKAIKALGGQAKVDKLKNMTWNGTFTAERMGQKIPVKINGSFQGWDKQRLELMANFKGKNEDSLLIIHGKKGWGKDQYGVREIGKEYVIFRDVFFAVRGPQFLTGLKDKAFGLSYLGELKVADQQTIGLRIRRKEAPDLNVYFSQKTLLPVKADIHISEPKGKEMDLEILFGDYKEFDGLKHYTKLTFKADGKSIDVNLSDLRPGAQLEASLFDRP
jgi:hypothetical protein